MKTEDIHVERTMTGFAFTNVCHTWHQLLHGERERGGMGEINRSCEKGELHDFRHVKTYNNAECEAITQLGRSFSVNVNFPRTKSNVFSTSRISCTRASLTKRRRIHQLCSRSVWPFFWVDSWPMWHCKKLHPRLICGKFEQYQVLTLHTRSCARNVVHFATTDNKFFFFFQRK